MAAPRPSGAKPRKCGICRADLVEMPTEQFETCPYCGNRLELARDKPATIYLAAFPILDQQTMSVFERIAGLMTQAEPARVDLDFKGVSFLTSAALGKLLALAKTAKEAKIPVSLHHLDANIREVVEITGLKRLLASET